jgi:hypothetical protein
MRIAGVAKEESEGSADNCIMTGFLFGTFGRHNALIIIRPASI